VSRSRHQWLVSTRNGRGGRVVARHP
jgi:hypothetical protein